MRLMVATPAYGGAVTLQYFGSMLQLAWAAQKRGLPLDVKLAGSESLITRARNVLTHMFLKSDATHLLFIDADIGFSPDDVFAMLETGKDVVCGAYPKKSIDWARVREAAVRGDEDIAAAGADLAVNFLGDTALVEDGCVEVLDAPTGFMMIRREVLERMVLAMPETLYLSDHPDTAGQPLYALFDCIIDERRYLSEDYTFCRRWQKLGGKVHLFVGARLTHTGSHTYSGAPLDIMKPIYAGQAVQG